MVIHVATEFMHIYQRMVGRTVEYTYWGSQQTESR